MEKLEILYPREKAEISSGETDEKIILRQIKKLEDGKTIKRYKNLLWLLQVEKTKVSRFTCGKCSEEFMLKDLTLHRFVSYSNTIDNDRYEDDNIICPKCGCYNYIWDKISDSSLVSDSLFKEVIEIQK